MIRIDDPERIGPALAELRNEHTVRRRDVALAVGMHEQQYGQYELGRIAPTVAVLIRLAHALGYDLALIPRGEA